MVSEPSRFLNMHLPRKSQWGRMRHLGETPPEYWSNRDRLLAGALRTKAFRARDDAHRRYGGPQNVPYRAERRLYATYPGGKYWPLTPRCVRGFRGQADLLHGDMELQQLLQDIGWDGTLGGGPFLTDHDFWEMMLGLGANEPFDGNDELFENLLLLLALREAVELAIMEAIRQGI